MARIMTRDLLRQIENMHDLSGGAVYPPTMEKRMIDLERKGFIERHYLANGKLCARITDAGRKAAQ